MSGSAPATGTPMVENRSQHTFWTLEPEPQGDAMRSLADVPNGVLPFQLAQFHRRFLAKLQRSRLYPFAQSTPETRAKARAIEFITFVYNYKRMFKSRIRPPGHLLNKVAISIIRGGHRHLIRHWSLA